MRTGNPTLSEKKIHQVQQSTPGEGVMTVTGTINKTEKMFHVSIVGTGVSWSQPSPLLKWGGAIGVFIVAMVTIFKKEWSPITAPIYAGLEGLFLGGISLQYASLYNGIVFNAVLLTIGVFAAMLIAYRTGLIQVTEKLRTGIVAATGGIALVYIASIVLSFFGINLSLIHGS